MAFIVEMIRGRPHQIIVYGLDDDGELCPDYVMDCEGEPDPEYRSFSCRGEIWKHTLDLGIRYGWKPMGTVPAESSCRRWEKLGEFENNYQPAEWGYCKQFQAEDAASLVFCGEARLFSHGTIRIDWGIVLRRLAHFLTKPLSDIDEKLLWPEQRKSL